MRVHIIGAGGHAAVVIATARAAGVEVLGVYDDDERRWGQDVLGATIRGGLSALTDTDDPVVVAIGDNRVRKRIAESWSGAFATLVHPSALVHSSVTLGAGTVVFAGAILQPRTEVGAHAIINTRAAIDHDCVIGDYALIGPGVAFSGAVHVGEGTLVGAGTAAIPGAKIGAWARIGAGAAVVREIADGVTAVGVPARPLGS